MVKRMFICVYRSIYTISFSWCTLISLRSRGDLTATIDLLPKQHSCFKPHSEDLNARVFLICEDIVYESVWKGVPWRRTLDTYWLIYIRPFLKYGYMEDGGVANFKLGSSCILFQRATRGSRTFSNMADILTEVMYLYSTGVLTCYWRFRGNGRCIVNYLK